MTIAITGATGQLGKLVVEQLLEKTAPSEVVAIVRDAAKAAPFSAQGVDVRVASYEDRAALDAALVGVDRLLLVSGSEVGQRVAQHQNVIDAAKAAGVGHVVYTSAPRASTSELILAPEHKATEEYLVASGLDYSVLRNNWYTENYAAQIDVSRQSGTLVAAVGDGRIASATRADFAAGAVAVLTGEGHEGKVYELGGDVAWTYDDLAVALGEVAGREVVYQPVDAAELARILADAGLPEAAVGFTVALDQNIAAGVLGEVTSDLSTLLGRPTTPLLDGLRPLA